MRRTLRAPGQRWLLFSWRDTLVTMLALVGAALLSALCSYFDPDGDSYAPMLFLFAVALISRLTRGYFYGVAASVLSVFCLLYTSIAEQVTEDNHRSFPDGEALVKGYIVNGKPLEERIAQIRITFCG